MRLATALATALLLLAGTARAQGNFSAAPVGGRSTLMGGTGVALARDGSAPFLNPATIIHIDDSGVAFSVNFYTVQWSTLFGFHQPGAVSPRYGSLSLPDDTFQESRADALPSTLCLFLTIGDWGDNAKKEEQDTRPGHLKGRRKLAACLGSLEREIFGATAVGYSGTSGKITANQATSIQRSWQRLYVGPSYSTYVSDSVALGASLDFIGTTASSTWGVDTMVLGGGGTNASAYDTAFSAYSVDLGAILGAVWHVDDTQVLGASVSTPTLHLVGNYNGTTSVQAQLPPLPGQVSNNLAQLTTLSGGFSAPVPIRLALGAGSQTRRLRLEGDASAYVPIAHLASADVTTQTTYTSKGVTEGTASSTTLLMDGRPVVDVAMGAEYFLTPGFSVLGGASIDFTGLPPLATQVITPTQGVAPELAETRMQQVAGSFGIGSYGDGSELLIGTQFSYGWGQTIAFDPLVDPVRVNTVNTHTYGLMLVIAGGASISAFRRTIRDLGNAVKFPEPR
jgi:hypothetical protein